jgi:hypothetical protein
MDAKPLGAIITRRLLLVALAVFLLQLAYVTIELASRSNEIEEAVVERELVRVANHVVAASSTARVDIDEDEARHYDQYPGNYGYELSTADGRIIDWRNPALFEGRPVELSAGAIQGMQRDTIDGNERLVALRRIRAADGDYVVRVAAIGDPAGLYSREFATQILDRVMLPIVPLTVIILGRPVCRSPGAEARREGGNGRGSDQVSRSGDAPRSFRRARRGGGARQCRQRPA